MPRSSAAGWVFAAAAVLGVGMAQLRLTPAVEPDAAWGLLASEQLLEGRTASLAAVTVAEAGGDLGRDTVHSISWWAPGQQMVAHALRQTGLPLGSTVKGMVLAAWALGIAGWALYFSLALKDRGLLPWLIGAFALFRMGHYSGYVYLGGETLLWGVFPWIALLNLWAAHLPRQAAGAAAALTAGILSVPLVVFKYSAALLVVALALWWLLTALRPGGERWRAAAWLAGAGLGVAALAATGVLALMTGGATPAAAGYCSNPRLEVAAWAFGGWLVGASDLAAAIETFARLAFAAPAPSTLIALLAGGLGIVGLVWLLSFLARTGEAGRPMTEGAWRLALATMAVTAGGLFVLQGRGACISFEGRHYQYGAFLALPLVATAARAALASRRWRTRAPGAAMAALLVGFPAVYGLTALVDKAWVRMPERAAAGGQDGLRRDWLPRGANAAELDAAVARAAGTSPWLLATPLSTVALSYPRERLLILPPGEDGITGRPEAPVLMLLPAGTGEAEAARMRRRFRDVGPWARIPVPSFPEPGAWVAGGPVTR